MVVSDRTPPEWFLIHEEVLPHVMKRVADSVSELSLSPQVRSAPMMAHWFLLDSLVLARKANEQGMHANALALTRQCVEALSVIELGICGHPEQEAMLLRWDDDRLNPGKLRAWLEANVWPHYGTGLWSEPWSTFMGEFAAAVQQYAHYGRSLAQWQMRLHGLGKNDVKAVEGHRVVEIAPRAYDPQKAARILLFHSILTFVLGRAWASAHKGDPEFENRIDCLRRALGRSRYLDGHQTDWSHQFWAMVWRQDGATVFE